MKVASVNENSTIPAHLKPLHEAVGKVVGITFFGEMLRTMRQSKSKGTIGHGGRGEEIFSEQLHGIYAEQMGNASGKGQLGEAIYKHLAKQQERINLMRSLPTLAIHALPVDTHT